MWQHTARPPHQPPLYPSQGQSVKKGSSEMQPGRGERIKEAATPGHPDPQPCEVTRPGWSGVTPEQPNPETKVKPKSTMGGKEGERTIPQEGPSPIRKQQGHSEEQSHGPQHTHSLPRRPVEEEPRHRLGCGSPATPTASLVAASGWTLDSALRTSSEQLSNREAEAPGPDQAKDPQWIPTPALYVEQKCCQPPLPPNKPLGKTSHHLYLQI
ncbi:caskin-1-like [Hylobates moloch]|uniref:caskin-1-like n=1 Tax=Hylobates moloch TaxID=81572 RepID=UPI0026761A2F|nr:caskin-1-like [Hylobates moloch]